MRIPICSNKKGENGSQNCFLTLGCKRILKKSQGNEKIYILASLLIIGQLLLHHENSRRERSPSSKWLSSNKTSVAYVIVRCIFFQTKSEIKATSVALLKQEAALTV